MDTMVATERVETVLAGGIPDRVPVDLHDFMVAAQASDMTCCSQRAAPHL